MKALIIEDHLALAQALASKVEAAGFRVRAVPTLALARKDLAAGIPDLLLVDLGLPDGSGLELIEGWKYGPRPATAIITAHGDLEHAIRAKKAGVLEFLVKPVDFRALDDFLDKVKAKLQQSAEPEKFSASFIGASPAMRPVFQKIAQACASDLTVLIHGPEGSGRSHVASLIHRHSGPGEKLLVLNGRQADHWKIGLQSAKGAWLILEEIDHLPMADQVAMAEQLRAGLGEKRLLAICREGGLLPLVRRHEFHPDLYYRLQGLELALPRLEQRLEDLPALCALFMGELKPKGALEFNASAIAWLSQKSWPQNLKQLRSLISGLATLDARSIISACDLDAIAGQNFDFDPTEDFLTVALHRWLDEQSVAGAELPAYRELLGGLERSLLALLLERFDGKPSVMAQALALNRSTLRKRLRELGLQE